MTDRLFLMSRSKILIFNDENMTRKISYNELRGITVIENEKWPISVSPVKYPQEPHDAEMLIHVIQRYD